jgi:hypothetical protein
MLTFGTFIPLSLLQNLEIEGTYRDQSKTESENHPYQADAKTDTFLQFFHQSTVIT